MVDGLAGYASLKTGAYFEKVCFAPSIDSDDEFAISFPLRFLDFPSPDAFAILVSCTGHLLRFAHWGYVEQVTGCSRSGFD